jgi:hypothetical protein
MLVALVLIAQKYALSVQVFVLIYGRFVFVAMIAVIVIVIVEV